MKEVGYEQAFMFAYSVGLTLVHFSAQLERCMTQENTLRYPIMRPSYGPHNPYAHPLSHTKRSS